jgi:hypothetical protein
VDVDAGVKVLEAFADEQRALVDAWSQHRDALLAKDTALIRERLRRRPASEHDHIAALKAHVFDGMIAVAKARIAWAEEGVALVRARPAPDERPAGGAAAQ